MRETALMDFLKEGPRAGADGVWAPTSERVLSPVDLAEAPGEVAPPIPTWPPAGERAEWPAPTGESRDLGPVPSRHRPAAAGALRLRLLAVMLAVAVAALVAWLFLVRP
jgi:hypothetical protein